MSGFRLDKYLVTVGRFRQFVNGGAGHVPASGTGKHTHLNGGMGLANSGTGGGYEPGWLAADNGNIAPTNANLACGALFETWTNTAGTQENLPINCVNWYEAAAFCIWDGGFLPSEAEWEYVAAGGSQELEYPWGSAAVGTACPGTGCEYAIYNCYYPNGSGTLCTGVANIAPVGNASQGVARWGQLDMAGEVLEWNLDWYANYTSCTDCADTTVASGRVVRGGSFNSPSVPLPVQLLPPTRSGDAFPADRDVHDGFRCARTP